MKAQTRFYQDPFTSAIVAEDGSFSVDAEEFTHATRHYLEFNWDLVPERFHGSTGGKLLILSACLAHAIGYDDVEDQVDLIRNNPIYQDMVCLLLRVIESLDEVQP